MSYPPDTPEESVRKFWTKIDQRGPDECWPWTGRLIPQGYGAAWFCGRPARAHRIAYELVRGPIPPGEGYHGTVVRHRCDNRPCCNPAHLELGTQADNVRDAIERGRRADKRGERTGTSLLTESDVMNIRAARRRGIIWRVIALDYPHMSVGGVMQAGRGKRWPHLPDIPPKLLRGGHPQ